MSPSPIDGTASSALVSFPSIPTCASAWAEASACGRSICVDSDKPTTVFVRNFGDLVPSFLSLGCLLRWSSPAPRAFLPSLPLAYFFSFVCSSFVFFFFFLVPFVFFVFFFVSSPDHRRSHRVSVRITGAPWSYQRDARSDLFCTGAGSNFRLTLTSFVRSV
jgi:hypothetical protein